MGLENLVGRTLEAIPPNADMIKRLLAAAARNIQDANAVNISTETRFDAAYKAILQSANAALQANGYRTLTSVPGHHMTMIQTLSHTTGLDQKTVIVIDGLRKQRNVVDYSGDQVSEGMTAECIALAEMLYNLVNEWLLKHKPELLA